MTTDQHFTEPNAERQSIIIVTGPTAAGKSALSVALALALNGEIINADSVQLYRGFDIGSAKITASEQRNVPHHLLSVLEPREKISAGRFIHLADEAIASVASRGKMPIVVGGTGLYIRALLSGLADAEEASDETRETIELELQRRSGASANTERSVQMHRWLSEVDPETAARLGPQDMPRLQRALEVFIGSGISISEIQNEHRNRDRRYRALIVVWNPFERETLYQRIDQRVEEMIAAGLESEVKNLLDALPEGSPALTSIGYREMVSYLRGEITREALVPLIQQNTRRFAKRQLTWWRNQPEKLQWCLIEDSAEPEVLARNFIERKQPFDTNGIFVVEAGGVRLRSGL